MATCKDCIYFSLCEYNTNIAGDSKIKLFYDTGAEKCSFFKNKADFVEVVRCKDCKYLYCFSAIDRQFYCKHFPKGLQGINIVEENPFCSYGKRK